MFSFASLLLFGRIAFVASALSLEDRDAVTTVTQTIKACAATSVIPEPITTVTQTIKACPSSSSSQSSTGSSSSGSDSNNVVTVNVGSAPPTVLAPMVHWSINASDPQQLAPTTSNTVHYSENSVNDPNQKHQAGTMNVTYSSYTVNLDQSSLTTVTYSASTGLRVTFSSAAAFAIAQNQWSLHNDLVLITYTENCGQYQNAEYCYFKVTTSICDANMVCTYTGSVVDQLEVIEEAEVAWGTYYPSTPANATDGLTTDSNEVDELLCGGPDPVYGLPTADLGVDFDEELDNCLGYEDIDETDYASYLKSISGNAILEDDPTDVDADISANNYVLNTTAVNLGLQRRARRSKRWIFDIKGINVPITADLFKKDFSFKIPKDKGKTVDTPFGAPGVLIKSFGSKATSQKAATADLTFYCVECGASGSMSITGRATFSLKTGVTAAEVNVAADVAIGFQIGIVANAKLKKDFNYKIGDFGLPGLIFGIVTIGPQLNVGTDLSFDAQANGQVLAGAKMNIQNAKATLNLKDKSKSSASGWTPVFTPILTASGEIALAAEIGFPIGLSCAINIRGIGELGAGIVERPSIEAKAAFAAEAALEKGKITKAITTTDGCQGIATQVTFKNALLARATAFKYQYEVDLVKPYSKVLDKGCFRLPGTKKPARRSMRFEPRAIANGTTSATNTTISVGDDTTNDVLSQLPYNTSTINIVDLPVFDYNTTDGVEYLDLVDSLNQYFLTSCSDGNIYAQALSLESEIINDSCSTLFSSVNDRIVADGMGRIMHYYPNTMSKLGVSRFRVADEETLPKTSEFLSMSIAGTDPSTGLEIIKPMSKEGEVFYPVLCTFVDATEPARLFVVRDLQKGMSLLQSDDLVHIVTGSKANSCVEMPIVMDLGRGGQDFDDVYDVDQSSEGGDTEYDNVF